MIGRVLLLVTVDRAVVDVVLGLIEVVLLAVGTGSIDEDVAEVTGKVDTEYNVWIGTVVRSVLV